MRWLWLAVATFVVQLVAINLVVPIAGSNLLGPGLVATHALLIPFLVTNRRVLGVAIVAMGLSLNLAVMVTNGGLMPVAPATVGWVGRHEVAELGLGEHVPGTKNVMLEESDTRLASLSDAILVDLPRPMRKAVSVGDLFIFSGVVAALGQILIMDRPRRALGVRELSRLSH